MLNNFEYSRKYQLCWKRLNDGRRKTLRSHYIWQTKVMTGTMRS